MSKIYSMTGYGRGEASNNDFTVVVEIKSVNHRFRDVRCKMSNVFNSIEIDLKKRVSDSFKRGSFDVYVNFKRNESNEKFDDLDNDKITEFLKKMKEISVATDVPIEIDPCQFFRSEFLKDQNLEKNKDLFILVDKSIAAAIKALKDFRNGEGERLRDFIYSHRDSYEKVFSTILKNSEKFHAGVEERLRKRFAEFATELKIEEPRFLQEVVYYLEKMDVNEETNRIKAHLEKLNSIFARGGEVGREIDFLIQELNRETNTIGSKSSVQEISEAVVQMKVQLEKIREQGLNLE